MEFDDFDNLSAEEFDKKHKKELETYLANQPIYSKIDMFHFATFVVDAIGNRNTLDLNKALARWQKDKDASKK